jgi:4-hydroxy-3-methylbut-2-enyl diphosphate reductase
VQHSESSATDWSPDGSAVRIGLTAGACTPNNNIGETVARIFATRGIDVRVVDAA